MLLSSQARHGCVRNVDGEGDEERSDSAARAKFRKFNFQQWSVRFTRISKQFTYMHVCTKHIVSQRYISRLHDAGMHKFQHG